MDDDRAYFEKWFQQPLLNLQKDSAEKSEQLEKLFIRQSRLPNDALHNVFR